VPLEPVPLESARRRVIRRAPLRSDVRSAILEGLLKGDPAPGAGIHEARLASELGVSRTPLREALLSLEHEGFLRAEPGRGFFVPTLTAADAREIYPVLWTLEGLALTLTVPPRPERLTQLGRINADLESAQESADRALELDRAWHERLLEGCPNGRLLAMIRGLKDQAYRYEYAYMRDSGRVITSVRQHEQIERALRAGEWAPAAKLLESNWRISLDFLIPWLDGGGRP